MELRGITADERELLKQIIMWGSDAYPLRKLGRRWTWGPFLSVQGPTTTFKTKREAIESFEAFERILIDATAGRI